MYESVPEHRDEPVSSSRESVFRSARPSGNRQARYFYSLPEGPEIATCA